MGSRFRTIALLGVLAVIAAACDWSSVGFDAARGGYNGFDQRLTPANVSGLTERWTAAVGFHASAPVVGGGRVFATTQQSGTTPGELDAYDATGAGCTGPAPSACSPLWSTPVGTPSFSAPVSAPLLAVGRVWAAGAHFALPLTSIDSWYYVGGGFDPSTGELVEPGSVVRPPFTEAAPAASANGTIFGYRQIGFATDASPRFATEVLLSATAKNGDGLSFDIPMIGSAPAVRDGAMYVMTPEGLLAFDATGHTGCRQPNPFESIALHPIQWTCAPIWTGTMSHSGAFDGMPAAAKGRVYVPELNGNVEVFAAGCGSATCTPTWTAHAGSLHVAPVAVTDTTLFVSSDDGHLYAFPSAGCGATTCEATWNANIPSGPRAPSVAGSVLFVGTNNGTLAAYNANGCGSATCTPLWSGNVGAPINTAPVISDGHVFVTDTSGIIHAFAL